MRRDLIPNPWRRVTASLRPLPDFLVIGAQRCGTTSLFQDLCRNPQIKAPSLKETHFFTIFHGKGPGWYRGHFPRRTSRTDVRVGEATPYYMFHPLAAGRAHKLVPRARLLAILRDPVDRAYSHYQHERNSRHESLSFEAALDAEADRMDAARTDIEAGRRSDGHQYWSYQSRGDYAPQLARWTQAFGPTQLHVTFLEEFHQQREQAWTEMTRHLGFDGWVPPRSSRANVQHYEPMAAATRARLVEHFRPLVRNLSALVGRVPPWPALVD